MNKPGESEGITSFRRLKDGYEWHRENGHEWPKKKGHLGPELDTMCRQCGAEYGSGDGNSMCPYVQ
jgi:hypothetical protein